MWPKALDKRVYLLISFPSQPLGEPYDDIE
ncbi:hypothetical protein SAMN05216386_2518 [Nitrosospira briensis]|uniref:Uncharacterized protein n=1 Tax=Nitrosospira briensis TaxID=35799 RepID=A0A1I5E689_9PROT|nr:hypothetical protein SAMN05216386_2518 [Nitrosospira briensis]